MLNHLFYLPNTDSQTFIIVNFYSLHSLTNDLLIVLYNINFASRE